MNTSNKKKIPKFKKLIFRSELVLTIAIFLVFVIYDKPIFELIFRLFKNTILVFCSYNYSSKEFILIALFFLLIISLVNIFRKKYRIPIDEKRDGISSQKKYKTFIPADEISAQNLIVALLGLYYIYFRIAVPNLEFCESVFQLAYFQFCNNLKYLDIFIIPIFIYCLVILVLGICFYIAKTGLTENHSDWDSDKPLKIIDDDEFNRKDLAIHISEQINKSSDTENSFSIGIVAPWGSGKSSFINFIKREIEKNNDNIVFDFNPWKYPIETNITKFFLQEIEFEISKFAINTHNFNEYINQLFKNNSSLYASIINLFFRSKSIDIIHKTIKNTILESGKRMVIFIDDLDRLHSKEVYEILTIIRNIGDLPNAIFVLAYDKDYLLHLLKNDINEPQEYLAKFFQVEFALSTINPLTLTEDISNKLKSSFPKYFDRDELTTISGTTVSSLGNIETTIQSLEGIKLIKNKRDIIKLMNTLKIVLPFFYDKVKFSDLLKLEILRLKYGNVFSKIKYEDDKFIHRNEKNVVFKKSNYNEELTKQKSNNIDRDELEKLVSNNNDRIEIVKLLKSLFPDNESDPENDEIRNTFTFDKYFMYDVYDSDVTTTITTTLENG